MHDAERRREVMFRLCNSRWELEKRVFSHCRWRTLTFLRGLVTVCAAALARWRSFQTKLFIGAGLNTQQRHIVMRDWSKIWYLTLPHTHTHAQASSHSGRVALWKCVSWLVGCSDTEGGLWDACDRRGRWCTTAATYCDTLGSCVCKRERDRERECTIERSREDIWRRDEFFCLLFCVCVLLLSICCKKVTFF